MSNWTNEPVDSYRLNPGRTSRVTISLLVIFIIIILLLCCGIQGISFYHTVQSLRFISDAPGYDLTVTADTKANATAQVLSKAAFTTSNAYPSYLTGHGKLAFYDPLQKAGRWTVWSAKSGEGTCAFTDGSYHVSEPQTQYFMHCDEDTKYKNFAFEVQLTVIQGDCGGVVFREGRGHQFYMFEICQNGSYDIEKYVDEHTSHAKSLSNPYNNPYIIPELYELNKIAVVANGNVLKFYVNGQKVDQVYDNSYTQGSIGFVAVPEADNPTEVAYKNARVWTL